eukprot:TRINITY_DN15649_c0_g1_i1.p1 TRINITY_DN15649_c0_g1~~TRINITY_DN15649_c0_g1_i1.p1  ORF type:complete len:216 (-),score=74.21 TRINITY_DN15649_c0_g1_i1:72-719(-)
MGRVRTKTVKKASRLIIERYYPKLTTDFQQNKSICKEVADIPTKKLRNKVAGFVTHLMRRIALGPVRGISYKLQEEERERKDNYVPAVSDLVATFVEIDTDTQAMLKAMGMAGIEGLQPVKLVTHAPNERRDRRGDRADGSERREGGRLAEKKGRGNDKSEGRKREGGAAGGGAGRGGNRPGRGAQRDRDNQQRGAEKDQARGTPLAAANAELQK